MGISASAVKLLLELKKKKDFKGKVLQLGRQTICIDRAKVIKLTKKMGVNITDYLDSNYVEGNIDDIMLFKMLGFDEVHSIDYSDFENATYIHDFNYPVPEKLHNQYDLIFDGGTIEHIFHLPQVFTNIFHLLRKEGQIVHASPSHNFVDHGFYTFSPTLFYDYYDANKYAINQSRIFISQKKHVNGAWKLYQYERGSLDYLSFGGFGREMLGTWFVAQKTDKSTHNTMPQQYVYASRFWPSKTIPYKKPKCPPKLIRFINKIRKKMNKTPILSNYIGSY